MKPNNTKTKWLEVARRGKSQPVLVIDSLIELYKDGYFGKAHRIDWNPQNYRQFDNARWFSEEDYIKYRAIIEKASNSKKITLNTYAREFSKRIDNHKKFTNQYKGKEFSSFSNNQLSNIFESWFEITKKFWCFAYDYIFINLFLPDIVTSIVASKTSDFKKQNEILGIFFETDTPSEMRLEKQSLVGIAKIIRQKKYKTNRKWLNNELKKHLQKFSHLGFYYFRGSAYTFGVLWERLQGYLKLNNSEFNKILIDFKKQSNNKVLTKKYQKLLKLDKQTIKLIGYIKKWGALSNRVDETYGYAVHNLMPLWLEISRRLDVNYREFYSLTASEIIKALKIGKLSLSVKKKAICRHSAHAFVLEANKKNILTGLKLKKYNNKQHIQTINIANIYKLIGQPASPGKCKGKVRLVFSVHDVKKVERGDILVASATNPTYVPAMERAGAIVTDEGGLLSHAAIVSRELKVPCVVGTKIATKIFKDGDRIEVDAKKGIIKKI